MSEARKIAPDARLTPEAATKTLKAIDEATSHRPLTTLGYFAYKVTRKVRAQATPRNVVLLSMGTALVVTVNEVERQRRLLERLNKDNETVASFARVLIDETSCGQDAYTYLQVLAAEEENEPEEVFGVVDLSEHNEPIPYIPSEE